MKIVINGCYGGFQISEQALALLSHDMDWYSSKAGWSRENGGFKPIHRTDPELVTLIETKGVGFVSTKVSQLLVVEIPDEATDWIIESYEDGHETIYYVLNGLICVPTLDKTFYEIGAKHYFTNHDAKTFCYWKDYDGWHLLDEYEEIEYVSASELPHHYKDATELAKWVQDAKVIEFETEGKE